MNRHIDFGHTMIGWNLAVDRLGPCGRQPWFRKIHAGFPCYVCTASVLRDQGACSQAIFSFVVQTTHTHGKVCIRAKWPTRLELYMVSIPELDAHPSHLDEIETLWEGANPELLNLELSVFTMKPLLLCTHLPDFVEFIYLFIYLFICLFIYIFFLQGWMLKTLPLNGEVKIGICLIGCFLHN